MQSNTLHLIGQCYYVQEVQTISPCCYNETALSTHKKNVHLITEECGCVNSA